MLDFSMLHFSYDIVLRCACRVILYCAKTLLYGTSPGPGKGKTRLDIETQSPRLNRPFSVGGSEHHSTALDSKSLNQTGTSPKEEN